MYYSGKLFLFFTAVFFFCQSSVKAQVPDTTPFHFQIPVGMQYMTGSAWKPYQRNFLFGLNGMLGIKKKNLSVDWGFSAGFHTGTDKNKMPYESGNAGAFLNTGSETITLHAGLGQRWQKSKTAFQYAGGFAYRHASWTPLWTTAIQKQNFIGGYLRGALQYSLSPSTLVGPFLMINLFPGNTTGNRQINPTSISFGLTIGPSF